MGRIERSRIPVGIAALAACLSTASAFTAPLAAWPVQSLQGLGAQGGSTGRFRCVPSRQSAELRMAGEEMFDEGAREELAIRMLQQQLSDDWLKTRLKAKSIFLPYEEASLWASHQNMWSCKSEWRAWINQGEKRHPYIPSRPDKYYKTRGEWEGWGKFLGVSDEVGEK